MSVKDDIGASKYHPVLGPCKVAEENLVNDMPGRVFVYAGDTEHPQIFHVSESSLKDVCIKCDGDRVSDMGGLVVPCDACKGKGYV